MDDTRPMPHRVIYRTRGRYARTTLQNRYATNYTYLDESMYSICTHISPLSAQVLYAERDMFEYIHHLIYLLSLIHSQADIRIKRHTYPNHSGLSHKAITVQAIAVETIAIRARSENQTKSDPILQPEKCSRYQF